MAEATENVNSPDFWMDQSDKSCSLIGIGRHRSDDQIVVDGLRFEIRALTMQVKELTELLRQEFLYRNM